MLKGFLRGKGTSGKMVVIFYKVPEGDFFCFVCLPSLQVKCYAALFIYLYPPECLESKPVYYSIAGIQWNI